jgi:low affinity Fe/Cu permease
MPNAETKGRESLICELDTTNPRLGAILSLTQPSPHAPSFFRNLAQKASTAVGRPAAFIAALATVLIWACLGPVFHYSDTWQLVINTGTTIITFLMVFLIQSAQNRESEGLRLKLDAVILAIDGVSNTFANLDALDDEELAQLRVKLRALAAKQPAAT